MVRMRPDKRGRRKRKVFSITGSGRAWFLAGHGEPSPELSPFRIAMVKIGRQISAFKARMLKDVICRLRGETGASPAHGKRQPIPVAANAR